MGLGAVRKIYDSNKVVKLEKISHKGELFQCESRCQHCKDNKIITDNETAVKILTHLYGIDNTYRERQLFIGTCKYVQCLKHCQKKM